MIWFTFRQFRSQAVVAAAALAAFAVLIVILSTQVWHAYNTNVLGCTAHANCDAAVNSFLNQYATAWDWFGAVVLVVPCLVGIFFGAPLLGRELESGTFRLAWTQSISRKRWALTKLVVLGVASMAAAGLCSLLVTWWASPLDRVGAGPFSTFDNRDLVPIAYAAFAFTLGVAAGAVIRRTLPAMGAALAAFVAIRVAIYEWVRPHLMAPLVSRSLFEFATPRRIMIGGHLPQGAWVVSEDYVNRAGQAVPWNDLIGNANTVVGSQGVSIGGVGSCPNIKASGTISPTTANELVQRCINQLHITNVVSYQPPSRYWPFQIYESLIFVGLALAVGAFAVWWVRRLD